MLIDCLFFLFQEIIILVVDIFFTNYYVPKIKVINFNVLINGKNFFDLSVKNDEVAYEKIIDMSSNNDYTTGNLLDFAYSKKHYKLIVIDLK